jgi:hypothetical protein
VLAGSACAQPADTGSSGQSPTAVVTSPAEGSPASEPISLATCTVPTPATWLASIHAGSPKLPATSRIIPFATGSDTSFFVAELYSAAWSGVVQVHVSTGRITHIAKFKDPASDQAYAGGFDGHWLVWVEQLSMQDSNNWEIWAWDSSTGKSFRAAAAATRNGVPVSGPIVIPVVSNGKAAWVQADQTGSGEVHLYSLATKQDQKVASKATTPVAFVGTDLIWQHLDTPGQSGHLEMIDVTSGRSVTVPEPLASVRHLAFLAASESIVAWTDGTSIWAYRQGQSASSLVYSVDHDTAQYLAIAGSLITWDGTNSPSAFDVRSSSVTTLTPANGGRFASGSSLVIYWPKGQTKSGTGQFNISDVDATRLPALPRCQQ